MKTKLRSERFEQQIYNKGRATDVRICSYSLHCHAFAMLPCWGHVSHAIESQERIWLVGRHLFDLNLLCNHSICSYTRAKRRTAALAVQTQRKCRKAPTCFFFATAVTKYCAVAEWIMRQSQGMSPLKQTVFCLSFSHLQSSNLSRLGHKNWKRCTKA